MDREDWASLAAFSVVAEERSFTRASGRLGVSPSALSHTMRRLEERLRIRLLARSTRSVSTTEAGERLLARLRPALQDITHAVEDLGRMLERPSGSIRISCSRHAAKQVLSPMLPRFARDYPDVVVEVLLEAAFTDIVARRFDAGIRLGESLEKDMVAVPVTGDACMAVVATPAYLAAHPAPKSPAELRTHRCINMRFPTSGALYKWEFERGAQKIEVAVEGPLVFDDEDMAIDATLSGAGVSFVFEDSVESLIEAGALVRVLREWTPPFPGFFLYYPSRRQVSPALTAFIEAIRFKRPRAPSVR
jgi:DNA-binding transcriptional LysR family regulator